MRHSTRRKLIGGLYLAPAVLFVAFFTAFPLSQMIWMSFHSWSLIAPKRWIGLENFIRAYHDRQFWISLGFTLEYTLFITPILMVGGYLIALTRAVVFTPVVVGLGVSSLLWYWLFNYDFGLINRLLVDLGAVDRPIIWFGEDADRALWAIIASVVWKVTGFGMLLFVAAIQAVPHDITEAAMVDGAPYWRRVWFVILPLTFKTILLVTLISVIGSLLAFDQFFLMTAGQPFNRTASSVFWIYLNSFPYLKLGYGAALSLVMTAIVLTLTIVQVTLTRRASS